MAGLQHSFSSENQSGVFDVESWTAGRAFLLEEKEARDVFVEMLRAYEAVCGVEVLTYCVLGNHFQCLVRVPARPERWDVPMAVLLPRLERALGDAAMGQLRRKLDLWRESGNEGAMEEWRRRQVDGMFSLSEFARRVKYRYSRWFNAKEARAGAVWEARYKAERVEENEAELRARAMRIDLSPVRAGLVRDPADYRWCGYAEVMRGGAGAGKAAV